MFCLTFEHVAGGIFQTVNNCSEIHKVTKHKLVGNLQHASCSHKNVILNEKIKPMGWHLALNKDSNFHYDSILNWKESCVNSCIKM